jgi:hypothetical protein
VCVCARARLCSGRCVRIEPHRLYIVLSSRPLSLLFGCIRVAFIAALFSTTIGCGWPCSMFACVFIDIDITRCEKLSTSS